MHVYAFGSVCRGEVFIDSDIDLLAIVSKRDERWDPEKYSIYSYERLSELWQEGNPFAWHLFSESRLLFASDGADFLKGLNSPGDYKSCLKDCEKFFRLFLEARESIKSTPQSLIFDLSTIFLSLRNIATCYSLGVNKEPVFSRQSATKIGSRSLSIEPSTFRIFERSRILSTRGLGFPLNSEEIAEALATFNAIEVWMRDLVERVKINERV